MIRSADVRKKHLSALRSNSQKIVGKQKLYYQGKTQSFDVFAVDLDDLIYNMHNGRLEVELLTWQTEHSVSPDYYDDDLHTVIEGFLWETHPIRNRQTLIDLEEKGQQRAAIVSLDGVIIDGNRRAMLLRKLEKKRKEKLYLDAIILPDAYYENPEEIVRLETQYQLGEDAKLEYGALEKYLHARRLRDDFNINVEEIGKLMGENAAYAQRLLDIMDLMDEYLAHIGCPGFYRLLKDKDGTKEGMFVDLYGDLNRLENGRGRIPWDYDPELEPLFLKNIHFDYMRLGDFPDAVKSYREISHQSKGKNFLSHREIWERFRDSHLDGVDPITAEMGTLDEFIEENRDFDTKLDAARARDAEWAERAKPTMLGNFGRASNALEVKVSELLPKENLERALNYLHKVDINSSGFLSDPDVPEIVKEISRESWEMKKRLERVPARGNGSAVH